MTTRNGTIQSWARMATVLCMTTLTSTVALAATPKTSTIEGVLTSAGGGAAADGDYAVTFSIYASATAKTALWTETASKVPVKSGRFSWTLGSQAPLSMTKIAAAATPFLGVKIGTDPELPRRALNSVLFALHAASADALTCTGCISATQLAGGSIPAAKVGFTYAGSTTKGGPASDLKCSACVSVSELKFDGDINLGGNSLKAKNAVFSGDLAAATVTATSFVGDGSKLTGIKTPSGTCSKAGEVVKGINANGTLQCVKALDPTALPKDGLNEISNDLLSNQFIDTIETTDKMVKIPDNKGTEAISTVNFPDIGVSQTFALYVHVENTDLSKVSMVVLPPDDKKTGWTLCDPCGKTSDLIYKKTFTPTAKPKSGDIGKWIGMNPKGPWTLKVLDVSFCLPQILANKPYCNGSDGKDGFIKTWNIKIQTLSNQKVQLNGNLLVSGNVLVGGSVRVGADTRACNGVTKGAIAWSAKRNTFMGCNGKRWSSLNDDIGRSAANPGRTCKDIKTRNPSATDGKYWIDPDGSGKDVPYIAYCDQTRDGGGWTLGMKHWYQSYIWNVMPGNRVGNWGSLDSLNTIKTHAFKMSDARIRNIIGPSQNFDVLYDQNGYNSSYSYRNIEYIVMRNYTGKWRFDARMPESTTTKVVESWNYDGTLMWKGEAVCGTGTTAVRGINCSGVRNGSKNPNGGRGCSKNESRNNWAGNLTLYMFDSNSDSYIYICNGAQHSSGQNMAHRYWFRERK